MKVTDILRVKGNTLYTSHPDQSLAEALKTMAELDIGSLVVMEHGDLVGMLTFREVISAIHANGGSVGTRIVRSVMDDAAKTVVDAQDFENRMLKAYIRDWPAESEGTPLPGA
jgi:CBS domain-containing protein